MINKFVKQKVNKFSIAGVCALASFSANAFEIENNGWTFSVHGNVGAHIISTSCDDSGAVVTGGFQCTGSTDPTAVTNGYLPTGFEFAVAGKAGDYDIKVKSIVDRGLDSNQAFNVSPGNDEEGFRVNLTIGNENMGTLLAGREFGLFGMDAAFTDMSVYGVGGSVVPSSPLNAQNAAASTGYIFLDRITQFTYTFPTSDAVVAQLGIFQPQDISLLSGTSGTFANADSGSETPGVHGRFRFNFDGGFVSSSFLTQEMNAVAGALTADYTATAIDLVGQINLGNIELTASVYQAKGVGQYSLFIDPVDAMGEARDSDGYLVQAIYNLNKTRFGVNYGVSNLDNTANDPGTTLEKKDKISFGVYHELAPGLTWSTEYSKVVATNRAGGENENDVINTGLIFFF